MRKFLDQNFWSHGTPLGSLGTLSREDPILGFDQHQIPVIWGPYEPPVVVALETFAENPKTAGSRCETEKQLHRAMHYHLEKYEMYVYFPGNWG